MNSNGSNKPFPLFFIIFASVLVILPASWLGPIELFVFSVTRPFTKAAGPSNNPLEEKIKQLESENAVLVKENRELNDKLKSIAKFMETQPSAIQLKESYDIIIAGVIIPDDSSSWRKSMLLNRGKTDGLKEGMIVISGKYLIGRISADVGFWNSRVELITDPDFRTKALCLSPPAEPTAGEKGKEKDGSAPLSGLGVLEGWSTDQCQMKWVARDVPVKPGWLVFSADDRDRITPRGLLIGRVILVQEESYLWQLTVEPAINPRSLTSVLILKPKQGAK